MKTPESQTLLDKNLKALAHNGQSQAFDWLNQAPPLAGVNDIQGEDGSWIMVVEGRSQASRRDPIREARQWLNKTLPPPGPEQTPRILFGFGSPWAARILLESGPLWVYEPDPRLCRSVLAHYDFSSNLETPPSLHNCLTILCPKNLAQSLKELKGAVVLVHPPAQRRAGAQLINLKRLLKKPKPRLAGLNSQKLKIMVIPPISGGSLSIASSLARAVESEKHILHYLAWPQELADLEKAAQQVFTEIKAKPKETGNLTALLFGNSASLAAQAVDHFKPDLVLVLAQAPLDAPGVIRLRESYDAVYAFWAVEDLNLFSYVAEVAPAYDFLFHIQAGLAENITLNWGLDPNHTHYLPLAADPDIFRPRPQAQTLTNSYEAELSFMGAGYPNRRILLRNLAKNYWLGTGRDPKAFKIFGSGWKGTETEFGVHLHEGGRRVSQLECALIYASSRINLNLHSSFKTDQDFAPESFYVNPRTFEIAAAAGFQIVDHRPLLAGLFAENEELVVARSPLELPQLIDYYLQHPRQAQEIGQAARRRVLKEHTYAHRLKQLLSCMGWPQ